MSEQEMLNRIKELEEENAKLKSKKVPKNIIGSMNAQKELDFIYPRYDRMGGSHTWKRSSIASTDFSHLRKIAMNVVYTVDTDNCFKSQKVAELSREDFELVVNCADEIAKIIAKYKKQYLESVVRIDIVEAYGM